MTYAELVRTEAGDTGVPQRDITSGDGVSTDFYVLAVPVRADSQVVKVGTSIFTEVPSAPGAGQYTFDDATGLTSFGVAPVSGTDNVVWTYKSVYLGDDSIDQACALYGLTPGDTVDPAQQQAVLLAASSVCRWISAKLSADYDVSLDGQSFSRSQAAAAFAERAKELLERAKTPGTTVAPLVSNPVTIIDAYNRDEVTTRDVQNTSRNPRRRYYGQEDRIP